jgi:hypothetical protein
MTVRSKQLAVVDALTTSLITLYTVPTGYRTIVKEIVTTNTDSAARTNVFALFDGSTRLMLFILHLAASGAAGETVVQDLWLVLDEGQKLSAQTSGGTSRLIVSGAELFL